MTGGMVLLLWLVVGPIVCAAIASARGLEWWVGALLGVTGCVGLVIVCVMKTPLGVTSCACGTVPSGRPT